MEVTVKGVTVYYESHGSGKPILMIHGWSPDHRLMKGCMEPVFEAVDGDWQRIYLDLPGMGKTAGAPWITGAGPMLEVVLGFIDAIIPGQPFLVAGESFGGYLARGLIHDRAADIDGLMLLCPLMTPYVATEAGVYKGDVPEPLVLERDEALLSGLSSKDREQFEGITVILNERVWTAFRKNVLPGLEVADLDFLEKTLGQNVPFAFEVDRLDEPYAKPTLILLGRQDWAVGYRDAWKIIENYPRASFVVLDRAGHNLQIEQDVLFGVLVKEWLDRVAAEV
jgi:pimeloyl-ACP methyl ester carboxylesterase